MIAVEGIYTGTEVRLLEPIHVRPNVRVIVMFLEDESPRVENVSSRPVSKTTQEFLQKCGGWEDTRSPDEIVSEIYAARTNSVWNSQKKGKGEPEP